MATDVKLDEIDGTYLVLESRVVKAACSDFMLDSPERRNGKNPHRRALVHDQSDGLTINFDGDYPGGVRINKVAELSPLNTHPNHGIGININEKGPGGMGKLIPAIPELVVRGGISFEKYGEKLEPVTVSLGATLAILEKQISELNIKVAALEKK